MSLLAARKAPGAKGEEAPRPEAFSRADTSPKQLTNKHWHKGIYVVTILDVSLSYWHMWILFMLILEAGGVWKKIGTFEEKMGL